MAFAYESMKLDGCLRRWPSHGKTLFAIMHYLEIWQHHSELHKTKMYTDNVYLKYFVAQTHRGADGGRFDPQTGPRQCNARHAKYTGRIPSNVDHPNLVANIYRRRKFVMQDKRMIH
jgi:hypothetical protein